MESQRNFIDLKFIFVQFFIDFGDAAYDKIKDLI